MTDDQLINYCSEHFDKQSCVYTDIHYHNFQNNVVIMPKNQLWILNYIIKTIIPEPINTFTGQLF